MNKKARLVHALLIITILLYIFPGCSRGEEEEHAHDHNEAPTVSITLWTGEMEMFTEYEAPVAEHPVKFIIHLTKLTDFSPVRSGAATLTFKEQEGPGIIEKVQTELLREGIFTPLVEFGKAGIYNASLSYEGEGLREIFDLGTIEVHGDHHFASPEEEPGEYITFLKEQQWKTEFGTEEVRVRPIKASITAVGELIPRQQDHVEITAPLAGILDPAVNRYMAAPGSFVKKGTVLALLAPQAGAGESWQRVKLSLKQAEDRFHRGERLLGSGAISKREFEDLQREYQLLKAGFPENKKGRSRYFSVTSPISGIIEKLTALPGSYLEKGDPILHISSRSTIWLRLNVYEQDMDLVTRPAGADIRSTGTGDIISIPPDSMKLLSRQGVFDNRTGSVPFIFEVENSNGKLRVGQMVETRLYTGDEREAVCVPRSAVYNDEGRKVVFVQTGGESFEKRPVRTGSVFRGYIEILKGVTPGEHVVTRGIYFIKLAGTSTDIGHGHTH